MRTPILILGIALVAGVFAAMMLVPTPDEFERRAEEWIERGGPSARAEAEKLFRQALARDPASPYRWCSLAEGLAQSGQAKTAEYCFRRAVDLGPNIPPVLMRAANFYFAAGQTESGLACTRRILSLVRDYDAAVFSTYSRMGVAPSEVFGRGLPDEPAPQRAYFRHVLGAGALDDAARAWSWLEHTGHADAEAAGAYCEFLLARHEYAAASALWLHSMGSRSPDYLRPNRIFNGGFESEPAKAGLDWQIGAADGVLAAIEAGTAHTGAHCLRLTFEGRGNPAYGQVTQQVVAGPGLYRFRALVRAAQVTTDQGVRFRIVDAESPGRLNVTTDQVTGTVGWTELKTVVTVRPPSRIIRIEVIRQPSLKFDNKISGTVWIDDVELAPAET